MSVSAVVSFVVPPLDDVLAPPEPPAPPMVPLVLLLVVVVVAVVPVGSGMIRTSFEQAAIAAVIAIPPSIQVT